MGTYYTISELADYGTFLGGATALILLFMTLSEYKKQGAQKRADYFKAMIDKFKNTQHFLEICALLDDDNNPELNKFHYRIRRSYLNFFEELALMVNSRLISKELALYMFGYYAIRARGNKYFKDEFAFEGPYWSLFVEFVEKMEAVEKSKKFSNSKFKF